MAVWGLMDSPSCPVRPGHLEEVKGDSIRSAAAAFQDGAPVEDGLLRGPALAKEGFRVTEEWVKG